MANAGGGGRAQQRAAARWRALWLPAAFIAAGCGGEPPTVFVGESAHFRLYVDPDLMPLPAAFAGDHALAALETEWSDVETMLKMPDGKITYRWYTSAHVAAACGEGEGGCMKEAGLEVDAPTLPHEHELNHAYAYLRAQRRPIPFLAEGLAEAIACDGVPQAAGTGVDWRSMVASLSSTEVQNQGGLLVRTLIRTHGIDAFLRYYEQSPERRDPALFGANFDSFWGISLDDVWSEAHAATPVDTKICPCSLPALLPAGAVANDLARAPYWTVPADLGGETLALTAGVGGATAVIDCSGVGRMPSGNVFLARLASGAGWFVRAPLAAASLDHFVADDCAGAIQTAVEADPVGGISFLTVAVPAAVSGAGVFVAIDVSAASQVDYSARAICDSCAFDQGSCPAVAAAARTPVSGSFYARLRGDSFFAWPGTGLAVSELRFIW